MKPASRDLYGYETERSRVSLLLIDAISDSEFSGAEIQSNPAHRMAQRLWRVLGMDTRNSSALNPGIQPKKAIFAILRVSGSKIAFATNAISIPSFVQSSRAPSLVRPSFRTWRMYGAGHTLRALRQLKIGTRFHFSWALFSDAKNATIPFVMAIVVVLVSCAFAGSQKRDFPEVLVTEDATPDNTFEIGPGWNREHNASDFNFEASIEKKLSENTSVEVTMAYDSITRSVEHSSQGFDNLEILGKWALFRSQEHEAIVTAAAQAFPSTGDPAKGAETHTRAGPVLLWEKGLGDLPDDGPLHYIRPFALLNELSYLPTWGGPESGEFVCNFALQYPLQYLADSGERLELSAVSAGFTPFSSSTTIRWP